MATDTTNSITTLPSSTNSISPNLFPISTPFVSLAQLNTDKRVRINLPPGNKMLYKDPNVNTNNPLLSILANTDGVVFPFQPSIQIGYSAAYQSQEVIHSNFAYYTYQNSKMDPITISGEFIVRTPYEGLYVLAATHFLRTLTLMFTGNDAPNAGAPPLVVRLNGMGFVGLDNIPVVITNVSTTFPDNVDYVTINFPKPGNIAESVKVPTSMTISVTTQPVFSRDFAANFSTGKFANITARLLGPYL